METQIEKLAKKIIKKQEEEYKKRIKLFNEKGINKNMKLGFKKYYTIIAEIKIDNEKFVDEDTGEVIEVSRDTILSYHLEDFDIHKYLNAKSEIEYIVQNYNSTLREGEKPRKFIGLISQKQQKRIELSGYKQEIINKIVKKIKR